MKTTEVAASSASQVGGMLSTYPRNRVGVCFPAAAVFSPFGLLYRPTTRGRVRCLRRLFLELFGDATANGRQILPARSTFQVPIEAFDVPIVAASKNFKASSSRWGPVSSCKLVVFICQQRWPDEWWLRSSLMKMTRWSLQGLTCIFSFTWGRLCKQWNVACYINK